MEKFVALTRKSIAEFIHDLIGDFSESVVNISLTKKEVSEAIESISATSEETTAGSQEISDNVTEAADDLEAVVKESQEQAEIAVKLNEMIQRFKV
ncbi:Protein of unknown function [Geosporobacter subterraneus DSM 17957]|uniref:Methyl-accepting chemotaxis protein n=1 Tax=Geosporobacter subterraneus DSM 17957 TaxID=1121919 RepID=A0A1M6NX55_9FIRM|nr:DUF1664 domain-containing protein [Geosporobacter subterraneus]SHK00221.1 Protein of unknown function [Geosporobacter subterraneus DSM 17957]